MTLVVDYLGCQRVMCACCEHLSECPLHNRIEELQQQLALRTDAETRALRRAYRALTEDAPEDNERCAAAESLRRAFPGMLWDRLVVDDNGVERTLKVLHG